MKCLAIIIMLSLGICNSSSIAGNSREDSYLTSVEKADTCELGTLRPNTSIAVSLTKTKNGEWKHSFVAYNKLRNTSVSLNLNLEKKVIQCGDTKYLALSGSFKETDVDDFAGVSVNQSGNKVDGKQDSDKWSCHIPSKADITFMNKTLQENKEICMEAKKSSDGMKKAMEDRMTSVEDTLTTIKQSLTSFVNTLKTIEDVLKISPPYGYPMQFDATMKGKKVELSNNFRTATRTEPLKHSGYAGVISESLLKEDQIFKIKIDETIEEWRHGGVIIGVIEEKKREVQDKQTIYESFKESWAIQGWDNSHSGTSDIWRGGKRITPSGYPLPTNYLPVGTILGVSRRRNGNLHFYLNGEDKGAAFQNVPKDVYAFVEVVNYVTKISITK